MTLLSLFVTGWRRPAQLCEELCTGSRQFGTQWSRECWCGPEDEDADYLMFGEATNCNMECRGSDDGEICGGSNAMSTYEFRQEVITGERAMMRAAR